MSNDPARQTLHDAIYGPVGPAIQIFKSRTGTWIAKFPENTPEGVAAEVARAVRALNQIPASCMR
jgi:hypothetical protein